MRAIMVEILLCNVKKLLKRFTERNVAHKMTESVNFLVSDVQQDATIL
jgi:hypothetical protein